MKRAFVFLFLTLSNGQALEVQSHGVHFEKWVRETFFEGYQPASRTQKWDIPAHANLAHGNIPVNPKAARHGGPISFGDAMRQFDIDEPFLLIVGFWRQETPAQKVWTNAQVVRVDPASWRKLWHPITRADLEELDSLIKNPSLSLEEARKAAQRLKGLPPFNKAVIQVNPKIDSNQRRLQCSLRFGDFFAFLAPGISSEPQQQPKILGLPLPRPFISAPRDL